MPTIRHLVPALALLAIACASKGGGTSGDLPTTLCTPATKACLGNYAAVCAADGRSFADLRACFPDGACVDGTCIPRKCTPAGKDRCEGIDTALLCSDDGRIQTTLPCSDFESCYAGACLLDACDPANFPATCTFDTLITCVAGARKTEPCPTGMACGAQGTCVAKEDCMPEEARCSGEAASGVCRLNSTGWDVTECKATEHCVDGFCQLRLGDLPIPTDVLDEAASDAESDLEIDPGTDYGPQEDVPFTPPNRATLEGTVVAFDLLPSISLVPAGDTTSSKVVLLLQSTKKMDLGLPEFPGDGASVQIEIAIMGVPIDTLVALPGTYTCGAAEGPSARLWLRYGLHVSTSGACTNFDFGAGSCTVTVTDVGPDGKGPLKGTFEAPHMAECFAGTNRFVDVTDGVFEAEQDL
jgi:hypothetical protein